MSNLLLPGQKPQKPTSNSRRIERLEQEIKILKGRLSIADLNNISSIKGSGNQNLRISEKERRQVEREISTAENELKKLKRQRRFSY